MKMKVNEKKYDVSVLGSHAKVNGRDIDIASDDNSIIIDGKTFHLDFIERSQPAVLIVNGLLYTVSEESSQAGSVPDISAPISGRVIAVKKNVGESVESGEVLVILEAMKMENQIKSQRSGKVKEIKVKEGDSVMTGDVLLVLQ